MGDKEETRTNPDRQAKGYVNELMDLLKTHPEFHQGGGVHGGQLKIPVGRMVVFPHISRKDYLDRGLHQVISLERTLLTEDLEPGGELRGDPSGEKFQARIDQAFPFPFNGLSGKEIQKLIALIYPILRFEPPKLLTVEDGEVTSHVSQNLHVVRWEVIPVEGLGLASATDIVDAVTEAVESAMGQGGGEILAARILVEGACRAHQELAADPEKWTAEIRAAAAAATGEGVWVEKVRFRTRPEMDWAKLRSGTEPLSDLIRYIDGLKTNEEVKNCLWLFVQ
jgi:hypothetical protein